MQKKTVLHLLEKVKKDYAVIAESFDASRAEPFLEYGLFLPYLNKDDHLLDVGCGNGRLAGFLKNKIKIDYLGIDNNEKLIELAKKRHPFAKFQIADMTSLLFPDESFDHVWNISAFHHIPSEKLRVQTLKETHRVLKKDGIFVITVWNLWQKKYRKYILKSLAKKLFFGKYEYNDTFIPWKDGTMRYYHAFTRKEMKTLLTKTGFKILDTFCSKYGKIAPFSESYNLCYICQRC